MTQKNIDTMAIIVDELANGKKLADALKCVYTKRTVILPYDEDVLSIEVTKLDMPVKITNTLMRAKLKTLMDVVNYCENQKIRTVKGLGEISAIELFETIANYVWDHMSSNERTEYLISIVENNEEHRI